MDKHLDADFGKSINGTSIALQLKSFSPKKFELHARVKKGHFGNFSERAEMAVPC